jgi:hypothetical protein
MKEEFYFELGDPSGDGHGIKEKIVVECNYTLDEIKKAYLEVCESTKLCFHSDYMRDDLKAIARDYEDMEIDKETEKILKENGIDVWDGFDLNCYDKDNENAPIDGSEHFVELFFKFVSIKLKDLDYSFIKENKRCVTNEIGLMGYGLFHN